MLNIQSADEMALADYPNYIPRATVYTYLKGGAVSGIQFFELFGVRWRTGNITVDLARCVPVMKAAWWMRCKQQFTNRWSILFVTGSILIFVSIIRSNEHEELRKQHVLEQ